MNRSPIYITRDDNSKLRLLLVTGAQPEKNAAVQKLREELDRAIVIDPDALPDGVVAMDSQVEFEDLTTGEIEEYAVTYPDRANVEQKRLSVLAPIGTALIGCRTGEIVSWTTPGGTRRLQIRRVDRPVTAAK